MSNPISKGVISAHPNGSVLAITVVPRSSRTRLERAADGSLRLRVTAPPVDGAANAAILQFLTNALDVPRSRLEIVSGATSRRKRIVIEGMAPEETERSILGLLSLK